MDNKVLKKFFLFLFFLFIFPLNSALLGFEEIGQKEQRADSFVYYIKTANHHIKGKEKEAIKPYLMPSSHPLYPILESIFTLQRATLNAASLEKAGFVTKFIQPRSFIRVASHPMMPGYLFKLYLDSELRLKKFVPGWQWFANRAKNARRIRHFIRTNNIKYFAAPHKWIYALPSSPKPPKSKQYIPKWEILVVEDMQLVSDEDNLYAWKTLVTKEHLDELYKIMKFAGGASYRAKNIPFTKSGKFAFVDTEYTNDDPDTKSIIEYLSPKMAHYWKKKIKKD